MSNGAAGSLFATPREVTELADCHFYTSIDLPISGAVRGDWDLRPNLDAYLGGTRFSGKRVLEVGPASGFVTFNIERQGAEVVCVEVSDEFDWDYVPQKNVDWETVLPQRQEIMRKLKNSFWLGHREFDSRSLVYYGSAYELPGELGHFDSAILAAVLLHNRDPLKILENCCARADEIVVADRFHKGLDTSPTARLVPTAENKKWDTWWRLSPAMVAQFLDVLGFPDASVTRHHQLYKGREVPMFTLTARRA